MTSQNTFREYQYVRRSVRRQRLMEQLDQPMTASQIAKATGVKVKAVCRVIAELRDQGLIRCLAPDAGRCRPYTRTPMGAAVWSQIAERESSETQEIPSADQASYAAVCHRHRSAVIRGLNQPRRASQIKKWLRSHLPGVTISANNIRDVLGVLGGLGVVHRIDDGLDRFPVYALTPRGQRFRALLEQVNHLATDSVPDHSQTTPHPNTFMIAGEAL